MLFNHFRTNHYVQKKPLSKFRDTYFFMYGNYVKGSGGEVVTSPPLNRKVGCSRPTMIRARCLRVKQHNPAQKNNQKKVHVILKQGDNSGSP